MSNRGAKCALRRGHRQFALTAETSFIASHALNLSIAEEFSFSIRPRMLKLDSLKARFIAKAAKSVKTFNHSADPVEFSFARFASIPTLTTRNSFFLFLCKKKICSREQLNRRTQRRNRELTSGNR